MPKCPYCGRVFRSERGLKIHIARIHALEASAAKQRVLEELEGSESKSSVTFPDII